MVGSPQNNVNAATQQSNQQVTEKAKRDMERIIKQVGIDPKRIVRAGELAEMAIANPKLYPQAVNYAIKENLLSPKDIAPQGIDWGALSAGVSAGKIAKMLIAEGRV